MNFDEFNIFCGMLPTTTYIRQWRGSHVWKVGGKVFAIGIWTVNHEAYTFKVTEIAYEMLRDAPGLRPAPYFASRGMKWIQSFGNPRLSNETLKEYLRHSHRLVTQSLPMKKQRELSLLCKTLVS